LVGQIWLKHAISSALQANSMTQNLRFPRDPAPSRRIPPGGTRAPAMTAPELALPPLQVKTRAATTLTEGQIPLHTGLPTAYIRSNSCHHR